jgi:predicted amidohydrolase YtcJ
MATVKATRLSLDRIATEHPIFLETYYGHGQIVNSKAMPLLQISETQADALGGYFERDSQTKRINGRIFEYAQWRQNRALAEMVSDEEAIRQLKKMADEAVAFGITSLQIMPTMRIEKFVRLLEKADLPIRIRAIPFSLTDTKQRDLSEIRQLAKLKISNRKLPLTVLNGFWTERLSSARRQCGSLTPMLRMTREDLISPKPKLRKCSVNQSLFASRFCSTPPVTAR